MLTSPLGTKKWERDNMLNYSKIHSQTRPKDIEITNNKVFIATNIEEYSNEEISGFEYDYIVYDKDEYIMILAKNQEDIITLREELEAAKIILGVE